MVMQDQDFWKRLGEGASGLFDMSTGIYAMRGGRREAEQRLNAVRDPYYQQASAAASNTLSQAGSFDPRAAAAERLAAEQGLLAGKDAADEQALMRMLHKTGMLGAANFNPGVEGIPQSAVAMNPQMAAFYAGRGARDARMAANALDAGEAQLDRTVKRSGMLSDAAAARQNANLAANKIPSRSAANVNLLKGAQGILKNTGFLKDIGGLFGKGYDWLGGQTGLWGMPSFDEWGGGAYDFDWWS